MIGPIPVLTDKTTKKVVSKKSKLHDIRIYMQQSLKGTHGNDELKRGSS